MFRQYNETLQQNDQRETFADQSSPQWDTAESHRRLSVSRPESTSDVVVLHDDERAAGMLSNQTQVCSINQNNLRPRPTPSDGLYGGILSNLESSHDTSGADRAKYSHNDGMPSVFNVLQGNSGHHERFGNEESSLTRNQVRVIDLSFDENSSDVSPKIYGDEISENGMPFCTEASRFSSGRTETQDKQGSLFTATQDHKIDLFEQNRGNQSPRKCFASHGFQCSIGAFDFRSKTPEDDEKQGFLFRGTQVQEQKSPDTVCQARFTDDRLGLGTAVEPSSDRLRYPESKQSDKSQLNVSKKGWSTEQPRRPVLEKVWPDDEPPIPKRLRTSLSGEAYPSAKKSSSAGRQCDEPVTSERLKAFVSADSQPAAKTSSTSGPCSVPVEKTVHTEELVLPRSRVYSARSVSLVQSEEGMRLITENTVAHTIFDDLLPESDILNSRKGPSHDLAIGCCNTKDQRNRNNATTCSTKFVPDESDKVRVNNRVQDIILSPCQNSTAVVSRAPWKTSTSYMIGKTDRADIAGGWKPICGQTVVRKPPKPSQNPILSTSDGVRKPPQPFQDSLWTTFDGAAEKSRTNTQLISAQERFGTAKKDREPSASLSASRSGVYEKSGNMTENPMERSSVNTTTPSNRHGQDKALTGSIEEGLDFTRVQSVTRKNNGDCQGTLRRLSTSVKNSVEVQSGNSNEPMKRFESETVKSSQHLPASSFGYWIESATAQNIQKKTLGSGASSDCGAFELPSRNSSRLDAVRFPTCRPGSADESSFGKRCNSVRVQNVQEKSTSDGGKGGKEDAVSKWHRFQAIASTAHHQQPPVMSSSLVRTTNESAFQHDRAPAKSTSSNLERTQPAVTQPLRTHAAPSSLIRSTDQSPVHSDVQHSLTSRKPEVACVTPQVRQPLRALLLDHDAAANSLAGDDDYCIPLPFLTNSVAIFPSILSFKCFVSVCWVTRRSSVL